MVSFRRQIAWVMLVLALPGQAPLWLHTATHHHAHPAPASASGASATCGSCVHASLADGKPSCQTLAVDPASGDSGLPESSDDHCAVCYSLALQFTVVSATLSCLGIASVPAYVLIEPVSVPTSQWILQPEVRGPPSVFLTA